MTYPEAIAFLQGLAQFGSRFGLETARRLADLAGNPQQRLRFIHVAGTNGKGSTCALLEGIYRAAGWRVGLYTSPHLVSFRERLQVNRQLILEADVAKLVGESRGLLENFPQEEPPTFFEFVTVLALRHFAEQQCDLVIWETGLGGRLDATNIVTPLATVITNIGHDHQQWLGDTLAKIAFEKAGIIKPGVPVISGAEPPEAAAVVAGTATRMNAPLTLIRSADALAGFPADWRLPLLGDHQKVNAMTALATVNALRAILPVDTEAMRRGLDQVHWPGRLQLHTTKAGLRFLLDGAHNPEGIATLCRTIGQHFATETRTLIVGVVADKDWPGMARQLAPHFDEVHVVPVKSSRSLAPVALAEALRSANPAARVLSHDSLSSAVAAVRADKLTVITGSLFLVGEALELLGASTSPGDDEQGLNEWRAAPSAR